MNKQMFEDLMNLIDAMIDDKIESDSEEESHMSSDHFYGLKHDFVEKHVKDND